MMRGRIFITVSGALVLLLGVLIFSETVTAERARGGKGAQPPQPGGQPVYFPYPAGIVPADIVPELERVRREVRFIYQQAVAEWHALPPLTPTGQPPTFQDTGYRAVKTLGKLMN